MNILSVFALEPDKQKKELLNIRQLVESVLLELFPYAESQGVTLRPSLDDIEPIILDRDLTVLAIRNLVHNAIKYSERGRVVEISLTSEENTSRPGKEVVITVKDHGKGIQEADKAGLFELNVRGDGLIETGNGLGLYCARQAASLQGGDVTLVSSSPNQGSVFRLSLPAAAPGEVIDETEAEAPQRKRAASRWVLAIIGLLGLAVLLFVLFRPPPKVVLFSSHDRYVTALGADSDWVLTQNPELEECGKFTLIPRGDKVALLTCKGRFVTAPRLPNINPASTQHDPQRRLWQETSLGDCGLYDLIDLPDDPERPGDKVAFRTCAGEVLTAGDGGWGDMAWAVVAETDRIQGWEEFTLDLQR